MPGVRLPMNACNECPYCQPYQDGSAECLKGHYKAADCFDFMIDIHPKCMFKKTQGAKTTRIPMPSSR